MTTLALAMSSPASSFRASFDCGSCVCAEAKRKRLMKEVLKLVYVVPKKQKASDEERE
jgi:hypothetical protein